tara:strand:- start:458 stop:667 length:210 start_codon:yes stop_codon:yes gene_type:complete
MRVKETITLQVNGKEIPLHHDGIKAYEEWTQDSKKELREWITELLDEGKTEAWLPFANFEASISFNIKE